MIISHCLPSWTCTSSNPSAHLPSIPLCFCLIQARETYIATSSLSNPFPFIQWEQSKGTRAQHVTVAFKFKTTLARIYLHSHRVTRKKPDESALFEAMSKGGIKRNAIKLFGWRRNKSRIIQESTEYGQWLFAITCQKGKRGFLRVANISSRGISPPVGKPQQNFTRRRHVRNKFWCSAPPHHTLNPFFGGMSCAMQCFIIVRAHATGRKSYTLTLGTSNCTTACGLPGSCSILPHSPADLSQLQPGELTFTSGPASFVTPSISLHEWVVRGPHY